MDIDVTEVVQRLNRFHDDNLWKTGRLIVETVAELAAKHNTTSGKILRELASHPDAHFSLVLLIECRRLYEEYPDLAGKPLSEAYYLVLATQVNDKEERDALEREAISKRWNLTQLKKAIREKRLAKKEAEKSKYGFDLCVTNLWYFNSADPRFGKSYFRGRIAGQIVANALHYYTKPGDYIVDPFAGSGTLGDVIDKLEYFHDRKYKMYDLHPVDDRIEKNDILMGIPEQGGTVDYVFLDPPYGSIPKDYYVDDDSNLAQMSHDEFRLHLRAVVRECYRVLNRGGRASILIEPFITSTLFIDYPAEVRLEFCQQGFKQIGKVYVANQTMRGGLSTAFTIDSAKAKGFMLSDCRELLTFKK